MKTAKPQVLLWIGVLSLLTPILTAQQVQVQEHVLDNGMRFLLVPRPGDPNVAAGWVAKVGSVNEKPGITGLSHLFEHMMFKGTKTIGTSNIDEDLRIISRLDEVRMQVRAEEQEQIRRLRLGEITDLKDPAARSEKHTALIKEFDQLLSVQKELLVKNEFDRIYTQAGASGMNAGTTHDFTIYFINVPANKLELWFWMESDRLSDPVFREFYSERDVVYEERRLRTDSTPTGRFQEEFDSLFWTSSPYAWPVVGWPSDLDGITREEALDYFDINYSPNNLVACLVGDFDTATAKKLAEKYFGRIERAPRDPEPVRTREVEQLAEKRMVAFAETNPQVEIRYHSVADGHVDEPALVVLGSLLSGQTGRLHKALVLDQQVATRAGGGQNGQKWAGYFSLTGTAKDGKMPEEVEQAIYTELDRIRDEPIPERELQKVKNQFAANNFRRIQNNFFLMFQLLIADSNRGWQTFNTDPARIQAVTIDDIQRVARKYLMPERRAVATYYRKESSEPDDPLVAGLTGEQRAQYQQFKTMVSTNMKTPQQVEQVLANFEQQMSSGAVPPDQTALFNAMTAFLLERLEALKGEGNNE